MKSNTKEKRKMKELLKSEDLEMVNLGVQLMKHLCPRKEWEQILLLAFSIIKDGKYVSQRWDWSVSDDKEVNVKEEEIYAYTGTWGTSSGSYWMNGSNVTYGTTTPTVQLGGTVTCNTAISGSTTNCLIVDSSTSTVTI